MNFPGGLKAYYDVVIREISIVAGALKEKGGKRFGRAFGVAGFLIFAAYAGVYMPPQKKSERLQSEIDRARIIAGYGAQYKDLREQLSVGYSRLPALADREQWLSNSVRDSLNAGNLVTEDFKPVREEEVNGLVFQHSAIAMTSKFAEFYDWLLRLESAKPMMHVETLELSKKMDKVGLNTVECSVETVIPKRSFR